MILSQSCGPESRAESLLNRAPTHAKSMDPILPSIGVVPRSRRTGEPSRSCRDLSPAPVASQTCFMTGQPKARPPAKTKPPRSLSHTLLSFPKIIFNPIYKRPIAAAPITVGHISFVGLSPISTCFCSSVLNAGLFFISMMPAF